MKLKISLMLALLCGMTCSLMGPSEARTHRGNPYSMGRRKGYASAHPYRTERGAYGRKYDRYGGLVAASRYLPCGSRVKVYDPLTKRYVEVTIIDWGPNKRLGSRIIDLSEDAYRHLFGIRKGTPCGVRRVTVVVTFRASGRGDVHIHKYRGTKYMKGIVA